MDSFGDVALAVRLDVQPRDAREERQRCRCRDNDGAGRSFPGHGDHIFDGRLTVAASRFAPRVARDTFDRSELADTIEELAESLCDVGNVDEARQTEAVAANLYWSAWTGRPETAVHFATRDEARVPDHWLRFDTRRSVLASANANRKAERPVNAILNFSYRLAEIGCTGAALIVGLDPGLGIAHLDAKARDSMALDLIEVVRPSIEQFVLDLILDRRFRRRDFVERADGHCRLLAPLTHELAQSMPTWARVVAPWAERVAHALGELVDGKYEMLTPLTRTNHKAAQVAIKARKANASAVRERAKTSAADRQRTKQPELLLIATCIECGGELDRGRHMRCPTCWTRQPGQDAATRRRRGRAISAKRAELERWKQDHPGVSADPATFADSILPGLRKATLSEITQACGVAKSTASMIRSGTRLPALRHWQALADVADSKNDPASSP